MDVIDQLDEIAPQLSGVASKVRPDQFDNPTPCARFTVRDLFDHMIGGAGQFAAQLQGTEAPAPVELSDADRPAALADALDAICVAAKSPGALGREVTLPFGTVPGAVVVRFLTVDGMVHSWDIATATGQAYEPRDELAGAVLDSARQLISDDMRDGDTFAAPTAPAEGASNLSQLIAFSGRNA
jgi:uncharacterized protein (TIGR03086 family)